MVVGTVPLVSARFTRPLSSSSRTVGSRASEVLDIRDFGAVGDGITDDTAALNAAIAASNTSLAAGVPITIFAPAGIYRITSALTTFVKGGHITGDGPSKTWFLLDESAMSGDLFSWSQSWLDGQYTSLITVDPAVSKLAAGASDFSVMGNRNSVHRQNVFNFYDTNDNVVIRNIFCYYVRGGVFVTGTQKNDVRAYLRESFIYGLYCYQCGDADSSTPVILLDASGPDVSTNTCDFHSIHCAFCYYTMLKISNGATGGNGTKFLNFFGLRLEGALVLPDLAYDNFVIGDDITNGHINNINIFGGEIIAIPTGFAGIKIKSPIGDGLNISGIKFYGLVANGNAAAIDIEAGQDLQFHLSGVGTSGTYDFIVGAAANGIAGPIVIDCGGKERLFSYNIDATSTGFIQTPIWQYGDPSGSTAIIANFPTTSPVGGNARGPGAVDFQSIRTSGSQVASGGRTAILSGANNTANGFQTLVLGGFNNLGSGSFNILFGNETSGRGNYGGLILNNAFFANRGDCQYKSCNLICSTKSITPTVLTSDGLTASAINVLNIPTSAVFALDLMVLAKNKTTGDYAWWKSVSGVLDRVTGDASYVGDAIVAVTADQSSGSGSTATIQIAADITNQGLSITWTAPNTDSWFVVAVNRLVPELNPQ